jgi:hypothetical protein
MSTQTTSIPRPRVPLPAGADSIDSWYLDDRADRVSRTFENVVRGSVVEVGIVGEQDYSGEVLDRSIMVNVTNPHGMIEVDAATARLIAADLIAAADELDQLSAEGGES